MVVGIRGVLVEVEADVSQGGLPAFTLVGLPDAAVRESRERVLSALRHSCMDLPPRRVTVNLAPGHLHKAGPALDLPIAVGLVTAAGFLPADAAGEMVLVGELSLGGQLKPVRGVLSIALAARSSGRTRLIVPTWNAAQAALVPDIEVYAARTFAEVVEHLRTGVALQPVRVEHASDAHSRSHPSRSTTIDSADPPAMVTRDRPASRTNTSLDLSAVRGQHHARRALEIAAAGGHNLLFFGPPGTGKTLLASRLPGILPPLSREDSLEVTQIHSLVGTSPTMGLVRQRPFRAPHHSISDVGLVGGGPGPKPGEVSLAHRGVLFLDELPEFRRSALEALRQPLEDGVVRIVRAQSAEVFPAEFQLIAAMNVCPCGYLGDRLRACRCSPARIDAYRARISGPLLDRIDMWVHVPAMDVRELVSAPRGETSAIVRDRVQEALRFRERRQYETQSRGAHSSNFPRSGARQGAGYTGIDLHRTLALSASAAALLVRAMERLRLSARAHDRLLRVARTIADLAQHPSIEESHVAEALAYRPVDSPFALAQT
jgi:magnesium chelatase family protein